MWFSMGSMKSRFAAFVWALSLSFFACTGLPGRPSSGSEGEEKVIRLGIVGLDTSHVIAVTELLNNPENPQHVPGARVIAAFRGGSPDNETSRKYIEEYTSQLRDQWKVEIVPDLPALCRKVDAVLLESVDGRPHLERVKPILAAKKPVFIDKPLAASYRDAAEIRQLAEGGYIERAEPVLLIGDCGTGKPT
jgi:hypothetical protein